MSLSKNDGCGNVCEYKYVYLARVAGEGRRFKVGGDAGKLERRRRHSGFWQRSEVEVVLNTF
jgi:hypothetical protein